MRERVEGGRRRRRARRLRDDDIGGVRRLLGGEGGREVGSVFSYGGKERQKGGRK